MTYIICTTTYLWGSNEQHVLSKHGHPAFARQIQKMSNGQCLINDEWRSPNSPKLMWSIGITKHQIPRILETPGIFLQDEAFEMLGKTVDL